MKITLITPTGSRPECFALCEKWMKNQVDINSADIQWIVVDDSYHIEPTKCTLGQTYLKGPKQWNPEINTQRYNMDVAMEKVVGDVIFVIEDDEYYSPKYLSTMIRLLDHTTIAGLSNSRYYNVEIGGYKLMDNFKHASLCHTAIRKEALSLLNSAIHSGDRYFDIILWERAMEKGISCSLVSNTNLGIGMKGMPGRAGLGCGHDERGYKADRNHVVLKQWLGADFESYKIFLK